MRHNYDKLLSLIDQLPRHNTSYGVDKISNILSQYKSILDAVNQTDDDYQRNTNLYYSEIRGIEHNIHQSQYARSQRQKEQAFSDAVSGLQSDIDALARLIKHREKFD
jgi:hypothetical protein